MSATPPEPEVPSGSPGLEHGTVHLPDVDLHYVRQGRGPSIVLLHGWPEFWRVWRKILEPLSANFSVIAPDLRG
ncbi:MAG: alpha/beta fold hydrolase, partial [Acidimicrobiia bacterium]